MCGVCRASVASCFSGETHDLNTNDNHVSIAVNKIGCVPKSMADMSILNINGELDHH